MSELKAVSVRKTTCIMEHMVGELHGEWVTIIINLPALYGMLQAELTYRHDSREVVFYFKLDNGLVSNRHYIITSPAHIDRVKRDENGKWTVFVSDGE